MQDLHVIYTGVGGSDFAGIQRRPVDPAPALVAELQERFGARFRETPIVFAEPLASGELQWVSLLGTNAGLAFIRSGSAEPVVCALLLEGHDKDDDTLMRYAPMLRDCRNAAAKAGRPLAIVGYTDPKLMSDPVISAALLALAHARFRVAS